MDYLNKDAFFSGVEALTKEAGFGILDMHRTKRQGASHVEIVLTGENGVTLDDCTRMSRLLLPRIEVLLDDQDATMEISSPGVNRKIKHMDEFLLFKGRNVKVYTLTDQDWISGGIEDLRDGSLFLLNNGEEIKIQSSEIQKAKLDYLWEAGKK